MTKEKIVKAITLVLWSPPVLFMLLIFLMPLFLRDPEFGVLERISGSLLMIALIGGFYTFTFILNIPYWLLLAFCYVKTREKTQDNQSYWHVACAFNIAIIIIGIILTYFCHLDYACRTSDSPLGSSSAWTNGIILGHLFWTLPIVYLLNKTKYKHKKMRTR